MDAAGRNLPHGPVWAWVGEVPLEAAGAPLPAMELRRRLVIDGIVLWP